MDDDRQIKIKVSNKDQSYTKKFKVDYPISMSHSDEELGVLVGRAVEDFKGTAEKIIVNFTMCW